MNIEIRTANKYDATKVQVLRKMGWRQNYINEESGITKEILENELAKLPPSIDDCNYYIKMINNPLNSDKNFVAVINNEVVGVVFYESLENGNGDIGVFVDKRFQGQGIGSMLLNHLIKNCSNTLEVTIFSKNRSRNLYKRYGFVEVGDEEVHIFRDGIYLPIQKLILNR